MKLDEFLKTNYGLSRDDFDKLPKNAQKILRQVHNAYKRSKKSYYLQEPDELDYKQFILIPLDQIIKSCTKPIPKLTKSKMKELQSKYNDLLDSLSADYIDKITAKIKDMKLDSLGLSAEIYVPQKGVPYYYDQNYKYLDIDDDDDLKTFIAQELNNKLKKCEPDDIGRMGPDTLTDWPFRLWISEDESVNPESLFITDDLENNLSSDYFDDIISKMLSPKYFDIPLTLYFYQDLNKTTRQVLQTPENFKKMITDWLVSHDDKDLRDDDAPFGFGKYTTDLMSDIDNFLNCDDELYDVVANKIADLWNQRYLPHAKELFDQQNKEVDQQVSSVSDELQKKYQAEIDKTNNPKLAKSLLAMTLLNHIAKTLSDHNTDMTDPLNKRLANKYDENIIYGLKDSFLRYMWKNQDKYPEMSTTVYIPEEPDKYHVYFCEEHNEDRRMTMLSPMEYYWCNKKTVDACPDCQVDHVKNYYSFYYFSFDLGDGNTFSCHLPYPIGKSWLPKLSKFKHVHQEFEEDSPFLFGVEADKDEIMYALSHDLIKDVKEIMK